MNKIKINILLIITLLLFFLTNSYYINAYSNDFLTQNHEGNNIGELLNDNDYSSSLLNIEKEKDNSSTEYNEPSNKNIFKQDIENSENAENRSKELILMRENITHPLNAVKTVITEFSIKDNNGNPVTSLSVYRKFKLQISWDASAYGAGILKEGDYFEVELPDKMKFPKNPNACNFDIKNESDELIARAVVSPNPPSEGGGKIKVTFTNYVEQNNNIKGTMYLAAEFVKEKIIQDKPNQFQISVDGKVYKTGITITKPNPQKPNVLRKYGSTPEEHAGTLARWKININFEKSNLKNAVIKDKLNKDDVKYIKEHPNLNDAFKLTHVTFTEDGNHVEQYHKTYTYDDLINGVDGYKLTFENDDREFTLKLGNIGHKQFVLTYYSTYTEGTVLTNRAQLTYGNDQESVSYSYKSSESGGLAQGEPNNTIKIIKQDKDKSSILLAGATFKIIRLNPEQEIGEYTTNDFGEIKSPVLTAGKYKLIEIKAPENYDLENKEHIVEVKDGQAVIKSITNKKNKIDLPIEKLWYDFYDDEIIDEDVLDELPSEIKLKLYRKAEGETNYSLVKIDNKEYVTVKRNDVGDWKYKYKNLDIYKLTSSGQKLYYTYKVEEVPLDGFENIEQENQVIKLTKDTNLHTQRLKIKNKQNKYDLKIFKKTEQGDILSGAKFKLYTGVLNSYGVAKKDKLIDDEKEVTSEGIQYNDLAPGVYVLEETKAPKGYVKLFGSIEFIINDQGKLSFIIPYDLVDIKNNGNEENRLFTIDIKNRKAEYPATGSIGSGAYILSGLSLIYLGYRRKTLKQ